MTWDEIKKQLSEQYIKIGETRKEEEIVSNMLKAGMEPEEISIGMEIPLERVLEIKAKYNI